MTPNPLLKKLDFSDHDIEMAHFVLHPSIDMVELRSIAPDWKRRAANYESEKLQLIGYRVLRDAMRNG